MTTIPVTDADREAADHALSLGLRAERESIATLIADTRDRARAAERERTSERLAAAEYVCQVLSDHKDDPNEQRCSFCMKALSKWAAIRARGERFPLSGADAPSEGGKA